MEVVKVIASVWVGMAAILHGANLLACASADYWEPASWKVWLAITLWPLAILFYPITRKLFD